MSKEEFKAIKFIPSEGKEFGVALRKRVNAYFKTKYLEQVITEFG